MTVPSGQRPRIPRQAVGSAASPLAAAQSIFEALYGSLSAEDQRWIDERLALVAQRERDAAEQGVIIPLVRAESTSRELRGKRTSQPVQA